MDDAMLKNLPRPTREEMVNIITKYVQPTAKTETLPFAKTCGRVNAEDVYSINTLPNYPVSRFDGIAVRYADFENGPPDTSAWALGAQYTYCNTGIAMPAGYDTMIAIEDVTIHDTGIEVHEQPEYAGEMVHGVGEHLRAGELLVAKGEEIVPAHVGLFAAGGVTEVKVFAKPRVGIIPTGDELVPPAAYLPVGKNVDSNSYMIAAYLEEWGARAAMYPIALDAPGVLATALQKALGENDAVIVIAGSSLGTKDYTIRVLQQLGQVVVPELAHGPGRKSSLSLASGKPVLGVAGPPLGAQITCDLYLAPFVSCLRGLPPVALRQLEVVSDENYSPRGVDFCERVHIYKAGDGYHIRSTFAPKTTRAQMQILSNGNFYRRANTGCEKGERTTVELLRPIEQLPPCDRLAEVLGEDVEPYA